MIYDDPIYDLYSNTVRNLIFQNYSVKDAIEGAKDVVKGYANLLIPVENNTEKS